MDVGVGVDGFRGIVRVLRRSASEKGLTSMTSAWEYLGWDLGFIYLSKESVAIPIPGIEELDLFASGLGPRVAVCERRVKSESDNAERQEDDRTKFADKRTFAETNARNTSRNVVVDLAERDDSKVESWEVVMQEKLALHQVEWEIVKCPSKDGSANLVVETLEDCIVVVPKSSLPPENSKTLENRKQSNSQGRAPPDNGVTDEVDLAMILAPEVDTSFQDWPGRWARVPGVRLNKTGVRVPHDFLKFPEFPEETGVAVVYLFCCFT